MYSRDMPTHWTGRIRKVFEFIPSLFVVFIKKQYMYEYVMFDIWSAFEYFQ